MSAKINASPDGDGSRMVSFVLGIGVVVFLFIGFTVEYNVLGIPNGTFIAAGILSTSLFSNEIARRYGISLQWRKILQRIDSPRNVNIIAVESSKLEISQSMKTVPPNLNIQSYGISPGSPMSIISRTTLESDKDFISDIACASLIFQRLGKRQALEVLALLSQILRPDGTILIVDADCPIPEGFAFIYGKNSISLVSKKALGPTVWFSGPWKPGLILEFSVERKDR